ncbi:Hypothetical predicted protein, partial [Paramuricea clavata]
LDERQKHDESKRKEKARNDKLNEESDWIRQEEQEAENNKRIREEKFALQLEEKKLEKAEKKRVKLKLPNLQISKFQGTYLDWVRFWSLFSIQIDQTSIPDEAKFSYLKELVIPQVRVTIEKLPADGVGEVHHHPICVRELKDGTYVDDINITSDTVEETRKIKEDAVKILGEGGFQSHKWHSNAAELKSDVKEDGETIYAMESLGTTSSETKRLGLRRLEEIRNHFVSDISTKRK